VEEQSEREAKRNKNFKKPSGMICVSNEDHNYAKPNLIISNLPIAAPGNHSDHFHHFPQRIININQHLFFLDSKSTISI
jgi:hypothetical protein